MAAEDESRVITKRDVPWYRNGRMAKCIFMLAGLSIVFGAFADPEFADARPGLIDIVVGFVLGSICGRLAGLTMASAFARDTADGLTLWDESWRRIFDPRKLVYAGLFFVAAVGTGAVTACLSSLLALGYPWVGKVEVLSIGGTCIGSVFYWISNARAVERWYRSLPD